jgi:uncharacterized protein (UPF0335 family)
MKITDEEINEVFTKDFCAELDNQIRKEIIAKIEQDKVDSPHFDVPDKTDRLEVEYSSSPHSKGIIMTAFYALMKKTVLTAKKNQERIEKLENEIKELKNQK